MRAPWITLTLSLLLTTSAHAASLAVLPLRAEGLQLNEANRVNAALRTAATKGRYTVQDEALTTSLVEASQGLGIDCDVNAIACAVELGKITDVEYVVITRAIKHPAAAATSTTAVIGLHAILVDVRAAKEVRSIVGDAVLGEGGAQVRVEAAADALFSSSTLSSLTVAVTPVGGAVIVDGLRFGQTPASIPGLLGGEHIVVVEQQGFLPLSQRVNAVGDPLIVTGALVVDPAAQREVNSPVVPFVVAGVGGVVGIVGGVLMVIGVQPWFTLQDTNQQITDAETTDGGANNEAFAKRVATLNRQSDQAATEWNNVGKVEMAVGAAVAGVGVLAIVGGVVWGTVLLNGPAE